MDGTDLVIVGVGVGAVLALLGLSPGRWLLGRLRRYCGREKS